MRVEKQNKKIEQDYKLSCHISLPKSRNFESRSYSLWNYLMSGFVFPNVRFRCYATEILKADVMIQMQGLDSSIRT